MFDPDTLYPTNDPTLRVLGSPQTLAHWRSERRGPPYIKACGRILYRGDDLNEWIESRRVQTAA